VVITLYLQPVTTSLNYNTHKKNLRHFYYLPNNRQWSII
jgi:alpha-tubulin suppressor-like RCC1 family protein